MELLEGEILSRRIGRLGAMPAAEVIGLGAQAASVLEAAHRAGIIHRALEPDNLFIFNNQETESDERVKVLDFGVNRRPAPSPTWPAPAQQPSTPSHMGSLRSLRTDRHSDRRRLQARPLPRTERRPDS